jgi:hypothetical protein
MAPPPGSALCLLEDAMTAASDQEASSGEARPGAFALTTPSRALSAARQEGTFTQVERDSDRGDRVSG